MKYRVHLLWYRLLSAWWNVRRAVRARLCRHPHLYSDHLSRGWLCVSVGCYRCGMKWTVFEKMPDHPHTRCIFPLTVKPGFGILNTPAA